MNAANAIRAGLLLVLLLLAFDAVAQKRGIRIDNPSNWTLGSIGSAGCPGTTAGSLLVSALGYTFSGRASTASENYALNDYCEVALPGTLSKLNYPHPDENGLRELLGTGSGITGVRYDFLDNGVASSADGFQWTFFTFPSGVTLVALYGLDGSVNGIVPDATSYIKKGTTTLWSGAGGYGGEYFCFQNGTYLGTFDGNPSVIGNTCLTALGVVFINGFD